MNARWLAVAVFLGASTCGCGTSWSFHGATGEVTRPAVTPAAVRVYAGDVEKVRGAPGAVTIGQIEVDGDSFVSFESVLRRASQEAARLGGTHFTLLSQWTRGRYEAPSAIYVVLRVPPDSWESLPPSLRPATL